MATIRTCDIEGCGVAAREGSEFPTYTVDLCDEHFKGANGRPNITPATMAKLATGYYAKLEAEVESLRALIAEIGAAHSLMVRSRDAFKVENDKLLGLIRAMEAQREAAPEEAAKLLDILRWREDMVITNHDGERVWLKPSYDAQGKQIGITDCCLANNPCDRHRDAEAKAHNCKKEAGNG